MIRVRAVSLNARDLMMARGEYNPRQKLPLVLGSDAAGEIVKLGSEVSEWSEGARVCPILEGECQSGALNNAAQRSTLGGPLEPHAERMLGRGRGRHRCVRPRI